MPPEWHFTDKRKSDINRDPIEGEFFTTEALDSMTDALVRESIQNSLDAPTGDGPVRVRFSFSSSQHPVPTGTRERYFASLWPHIESPQSGLREIPAPDEPLTYLVIEDFGTRGLGGDVAQHEDAAQGGKNDFYYFWRNVGRSVKESQDRGRWGLGKTVFQASSRINAFFGYTVRAEDSARYLMGQSVLKIHKVGAVSYDPYGYYGEFINDLSMPITHQDDIATFCKAFKLSRNDEPGLSIVIPFPDTDIQLSKLTQSVVTHYFYPILRGGLVVSFSCNGKEIILDSNSLARWVKKQDLKGKQELNGLLALAAWSISLEKENIVNLKAPEAKRKHSLTEELFDELALKQLRLAFDDCKRMAIKVPVFIQEESWPEPRASSFLIFMERDPDLKKPEDHFIRQGITISGVRSLKTRGVRAIVSIEDSDLATFLGDSENPAHTQWERNNRHFKGKYKLATTTLDYIKTSTRNIAHILSRPAKQLEENLLRDIFSVPMDDFNVKSKKDLPGDARDDEKGSSGFPDIHVDPRNQAVCLSPLQGGFRLYGKAKASSVPKSIAVYMAYEVRRGNPFKKYLPLDFEVDKPPINIKLKNARLVKAAKNLIQIAPERPDFSLSVTGYDKHRDLRVKTQPVGETA